MPWRYYFAFITCLLSIGLSAFCAFGAKEPLIAGILVSIVGLALNGAFMASENPVEDSHCRAYDEALRRIWYQTWTQPR